jgi:hypothetical protein
MKLTLEFAKAYTRELMRNHSAFFFTLLFPSILWIIFGNAGRGDQSTHLSSFIIYCNFAVQTVMLQSLGIAVSIARASSWRDYLQTLPATPLPRIVGRVLSSLLVALLSVMLIIVTNYFQRGMVFSFTQTTLIALCALLGSIPMALFAVWLGNLLNPQAARSGFVCLNTLLLFATLSFSTPSFWKVIIPSYQWLQFSLAVVTQANFLLPLAWLTGYTIFFCVLIVSEDNLSRVLTIYPSKTNRTNHSKNDALIL